ncbi:hypothetical protein BRETT_001924 [Brettanomyces bruxellensis]|uniref:GPI transamidase component PIG-S n=1 Tax=Dekkera bruxellensis TaxID=5007 RepID=A0A871RIG7_DEKBR|nr:uncharacterized protein BRETT_001924 [Brettanomyces bruxellensis]QOU21760.1 hypothetical protein BRETT_001924 [Brettanomyces bruxellensis]
MAESDRKEAQLRHSIVLFIVLLAVLVGLPIWYLTTTIYRANLPEAEIIQMEHSIADGIDYEVPFYVMNLPSSLDGLIDEAQDLIDNQMNELQDAKAAIRAHVKLLSGRESSVGEFDYKIRLIERDLMDETDTEAVYISPGSDREIKLFLSPSVIQNGKVTDFLMRVVTDMVLGSEIGLLTEVSGNSGNASTSRSMIKIPYNDQYKVSVSFLEEGDEPLRWDVKPVVDAFGKYLSVLDSYANFTLETQLGYYEALPETANLEKLEKADEESVDICILKDTSTFMDYSEWGLDQDVQLLPTINLVVYAPNRNRKILIANSTTNSFIVPQWGGVVIYNGAADGNKPGKDNLLVSTEDLEPVFDIFASQILQLLGAPESPKSPFIRADMITRVQCAQNLLKSVDNLVSLIKLTRELPTIPIPEITMQEVEETMALVNKSMIIMKSWNESDWWNQVNELSARAVKISDKAFFQKDMVQQAFFPEDHKMAVYMPLLGPFATIMVLGLARSLKERIKMKKDEQANDEKVRLRTENEPTAGK